MAKKRKIIAESKEPEYEFVEPEFDEKEFILKDIYGTKITLVVSLIAIVFGVIGSFLYKMSFTGSIIGIVVMFVGLFGLRYILKLVRLDPDMLSAANDGGTGSKSMLGNYFIYLFLCIAIWTLLINPPFA